MLALSVIKKTSSTKAVVFNMVEDLRWVVNLFERSLE